MKAEQNVYTTLSIHEGPAAFRGRLWHTWTCSVIASARKNLTVEVQVFQNEQAAREWGLSRPCRACHPHSAIVERVTGSPTQGKVTMDYTKGTR